MCIINLCFQNTGFFCSLSGGASKVLFLGGFAITVLSPSVALNGEVSTVLFNC